LPSSAATPSDSFWLSSVASRMFCGAALVSASTSPGWIKIEG
jgi:hypothetical protein